MNENTEQITFIIYFDKLRSKLNKQISFILIYVIQLYQILIDHNMEVNEEKNNDLFE
jgi:hypothetical protein